VVVLDDQQVVLAWNRGAEELWGVRREETVGQHFMNLDIGLPVETLRRSIREAVTTGTTGKQELEATNRRGRTFQCAVVVSPMTSGREDVGGALVFMEPVE
jgi:two-component system CheB/CheR fusion protein